jgi:hypothetical protein
LVPPGPDCSIETLNDISVQLLYCLYYRTFSTKKLKRKLLLWNHYSKTVNPDGKINKKVVTEDKTATEQMRLIQQLDEEDKQTIFRLIEKILPNKKFKDLFAKNVAVL